MTTINKTFYISSGRLNAMYTLRYQMISTGTEHAYCVDNYVCNLSTDSALATKKAQDYVDRFRDRVGENSNLKIVFEGEPYFELFEMRSVEGRGKLSMQDTLRLAQVELGVMPFGKNKGKVLKDLPMNTVLWWADQVNDESASSSFVFNAVCAACLGIALDMGYIAKRQEIKEERERRDALSDYIGIPKERLVFEGTIESIIALDPVEVAWNTFSYRYINKVLVGDNVVIYIGNALGDKGESVKFKATVKEHSEYKGTKQTVVQRPSIL